MKHLMRFRSVFGMAIVAFFALSLVFGFASCKTDANDDDTPATTTYTVTFDTNGGSTVASQTVASGSTATEPTAPTKGGYRFGGWYSDSGLTTAFSFSSAITANITLYAKWTAASVPTYTVTFSSNGGSSVTSQTVASGSTVTEPTAPTKSGYTFGGWYTDSGLTTAFSFTTTITANITLYAKWEASAPTEELLTTIMATGTEQASYSTANVATISFSHTEDGSSAYTDSWGWWGYGWSATVAPADGYTITKCVFYDNANHTATDSSSPFAVETTSDDKTPLVNGSVISFSDCKGIKKIEVYGYSTH